MTSTIKPIPCPFCGADRIAMREAQLTQEHHCWCITCEASGPEADTYDGAIMVWNTRKEPTR